MQEESEVLILLSTLILLSVKEVQKTLKQKSIIKKAAGIQSETRIAENVPQYNDWMPQPDFWTQMHQQRQAQSRMRAEQAAQPYAAMFAAQRSRHM